MRRLWLSYLQEFRLDRAGRFGNGSSKCAARRRRRSRRVFRIRLRTGNRPHGRADVWTRRHSSALRERRAISRTIRLEMQKPFKFRFLFAVVALVVCVAPCLGQSGEDSYEMSRYANALESEERWQETLKHPPKTLDEQLAATMSSEAFEYPAFSSKFGVGFFEGLAKIRSHGKVGYINRFGKTQIPANFDDGGRCSQGLARVRLAGKWGFINRRGNLSIAPRFEWVGSFFEGRALVKVGDKWGYIDRTGKIVINPCFDQASSFSEGLAAVELYSGKYKTGYIDYAGKWVLRPIYDGGSSFHQGAAIVGKDIGYNNGVIAEDYVISKTGRRLFDLNSSYLTSYSEGLLVVENEKHQFGYLDLQGKLVITHRFKHAGSFSEGLASVLDNEDRWAYIDKKGRIVLKTGSGCSGRFSAGVAPCEGSGRTGFIDKTGKFVIKPMFNWTGGFHDGWAAVIIDEKVGYINTKGHYVWQPTG